MTLRNPLQVISVLFVALVLQACAAMSGLGLPAAETFNQKLAVAYGTVAQVRESAATLLAAKKISVDDAVHVQATADIARTGLDTARKMQAADPTGADQKINAIRTGLTALAAYLAAKDR